MAHVYDSISHVQSGESFQPLAALGRWFYGVLEGMAKFSTGYRCAQEASRLHALTDEQLEKIGLERDEIVAYAFRRVSTTF